MTDATATTVPSDLHIARAASLRPIAAVAARLDIPADALLPHGHHIAKLDSGFVDGLEGRPDGRLVLVTAITPTPAGEGKTTTTIGLGDGLNRIGRKTLVCLREPSLGPCFGMKGGATGGGHAQVVPMERINLHFTGDFHAITAAHNLLAAMLDNHLHWGNALGIDTRRVTWKRVMDMNDRALRRTVVGLGGASDGVPREDGFDITVASEVMAILCLARDFAELSERLGEIVVGWRRDRSPVRARDLEAHGAMTALLQDAFLPNMVQTLENNPVLVHGGPFANIAHGCNSVRATRAALKLADIVVTEAGFGADLGAEKFLDIKCPRAGLTPDMAVVVATVRALKMHGGVARADLGRPDPAAVRAGLPNLARHVDNLRKFGLPVVVAINHFVADSDAEVAAIREHCAASGVDVFLCRHWAEGGRGAEDLARHVAATLDAAGPSGFRPLYALSLPVEDKIATVAREIYRADGVDYSPAARQMLKRIADAGIGDLPVCIAKTQYSFSSDASLLGAPTGHRLTVREVRLAAGAGFVVAVCGDLMTMPGLPRQPAAHRIHVNAAGQIEGLY